MNETKFGFLSYAASIASRIDRVMLCSGTVKMPSAWATAAAFVAILFIAKSSPRGFAAFVRRASAGSSNSILLAASTTSPAASASRAKSSRSFRSRYREIFSYIARPERSASGSRAEASDERRAIRSSTSSCVSAKLSLRKALDGSACRLGTLSPVAPRARFVAFFILAKRFHTRKSATVARHGSYFGRIRATSSSAT